MAKNTKSKRAHFSGKITHIQQSNKRLISRIYKYLQTSTTKILHKGYQKWIWTMNRHFSEDRWIANRHKKNCSALLIIGESQIKKVMRDHLTPVRTGHIKNSRKNRWLQECDESYSHPLLVGILLFSLPL